MDEYISKTKFEELMRKKARNSFDLYYADKSKRYHAKAIGYTIAADEVHVFPVTDVQPVVHAYWIELPKALNPNENPCKCSNCGHVLSFMNYYPKSKYCDDCGARMDLNGATPDKCRNYIDCDGSYYIDDTPCECGENIEKCKGRDTECE